MRHFDSKDLVDEGTSGMDPQLGHVRGKVTDLDGYGLGRSMVWIRETGQCTYTDSEGNFTMTNIVPAQYMLIADCESYSQTTQVDVRVEAGDNPGINFVMPPSYCHGYNRSRIARRRGALAF